MMPASSLGEFAPTAAETRIAQESSRRLEEFLGSGEANLDIDIRIQPKNRPEETIPIPRSAFQLLAHILNQMANGNGVTLIPMHAELTTQEAAYILKVSEPFLVDLLEKGELPSHQRGVHRRVCYRDLMEYKQRTARKRLEALEELSALEQELGLD
jgi:excisionase family DNA binding protein